MDSETLELIEATPQEGANGATISLVPAATMFTIMKGLRGSMPHIPVMPVDHKAGALIGHPGYDE